jgi:hypothetical protein
MIFYIKIFLPILIFTLTGTAQMVDPSIDKDDEPFCYFSKPTDVIGVMDGREGTEITPEGYLYTGFGELMFFTGNPPEPVNQRVKTLYNGYLPIIEYTFIRGDIQYRFMMFAATLDGDPESPLMNFIRVVIKNHCTDDRIAYLTAATRYQNDVNTDYGFGDNRFSRPAKPDQAGGYEQAGVEFNPDWEYGFENDMALRGGKVFYLFPLDPQPELRLTLRTGNNEMQEMGIYKLPVLPTSPVDVVTYNIKLNPREEKIFDFRMPYEPLVKDSPLIRDLRAASYNEYLQRTTDFWEKIFSGGVDITLPEEKVNHTFKANLVYSLIARDKIDSFYVQKVNEFQYDNFWLRDAAYFVRMYDISGYHTIARQCLSFFPRMQQDNGNYISQGGQYDGWGQTMWAYGGHYRITGDTLFARSVYPSVQKAVEWLRKVRRDDPLHLIPVTTPGDNENITGHVTGHNFWALAGLKNIIVLAEALGRNDDIMEYQKEFDDFNKTFIGVLKDITKETGGYIPPGLDSVYGSDWGNMLSVYPEQILDPFDPMATTTLRKTQAKYQEGIMTYDNGRYLHHYLTMKNTETEVIRGDQETAIGELYAILLHTGATNTGFEFSITPWSTRDFGVNLAPHGWFAAKFRTLVRNMMVREEDNDLHLFSCLSPEWIKDGMSLVVHRAPTNFGQVNADWNFSANQAVLTMDNNFHHPPEKLILHIPWFMNVSSSSVDGKNIPYTKVTILLPNDAKSVTIKWTKKANTKNLSFDQTVKEYKKEYSRRYQSWLRDGK